MNKKQAVLKRENHIKEQQKRKKEKETEIIAIEKFNKEDSKVRTYKQTGTIIKQKRLVTFTDFSRHLSWLTNIVKIKGKTNNWKSTKHNPEDAMIEFFKKFYFKYFIPPALLYDAFCLPSNISNATLQREIIVELAHYGKCVILNGFLTKKEQHYFFNDKLRPTVQKVYCRLMFIRAMLMAAGCNHIKLTLFSEVLHRKFDNYNDKAWYSKLREIIHFTVKYQDNFLTQDEYSDLIDYIYASGTFVYESPYGAGRTEMHSYAKIISFSGRTFNSVLKLSQKWHDDLTKIQKEKNRLNNTHNWEGYTHITNYEETIIDGKYKYDYTIKQILTDKELSKESLKMHNCVSSYRQRCIDKKCAIFSVRRKVYKNENFCSEEYCVDVEVGNNNRIVQMRSPCNGNVNDYHAKTLIKKWASQNQLIFSTNF